MNDAPVVRDVRRHMAEAHIRADKLIEEFTQTRPGSEVSMTHEQWHLLRHGIAHHLALALHDADAAKP
jgi:hypothetical protein